MTPPTWALSIAYGFHLVATAAWIASLAILSFLLKNETNPVYDKIQQRLETIGWFCAILLLGSGMIQLSANPNYTGFLEIKGLWAIVILIKHILFAIMLGINAWLSWGISPQIRRERLRLSKKGTLNHLNLLNAKFYRLIRLNTALFILVLVLTAVARAASG